MWSASDAIGAIGYPALGLGDSHEGMLYGVAVGAIGGALGGYGPETLGNQILNQWDQAVANPIDYFFSSDYRSDDGWLGKKLGMGFPNPTIGSTILFIGIGEILDDLNKN